MIEQLLEEFYCAYHDENYITAIIALEEVMRLEGKENFWLYSRLSSCYYELRDYKKALEFAEKAFALKPESPLVLWDYASVLIMLNREEEAIQLLKRIQFMQDDLTIYGFSHPEIDWMKSLKNDANFLIGKAYYTICQDKDSKQHLERYLSNIKKGINTIYSSELALEYLHRLEVR